jgi:hypothetical protein
MRHEHNVQGNGEELTYGVGNWLGKNIPFRDLLKHDHITV